MPVPPLDVEPELPDEPELPEEPLEPEEPELPDEPEEPELPELPLEDAPESTFVPASSVLSVFGVCDGGGFCEALSSSVGAGAAVRSEELRSSAGGEFAQAVMRLTSDTVTVAMRPRARMPTTLSVEFSLLPISEIRDSRKTPTL